METSLDCIDRHCFVQAPVHFLDHFASHARGADVRLVGHHHDGQSRLLELLEAASSFRIKTILVEIARRKTAAVAKDRNHQDSVAIKKHRWSATGAGAHWLTTWWRGPAARDERRGNARQPPGTPPQGG